MYKHSHLVTIEDYESIIGAQAIERIQRKAKSLEGQRVANVNSTYYGGGVAEILISMTLIMNSLGITTGWRTITGRSDFFVITKNMHNALQSGDMKVTNKVKRIFQDVIFENSIRMHLSHDFVVIHDPQPLPMIQHYRRRGPWIWRCHIDLSNPHRGLWNYLAGFVNQYDAAIFSIKEYSKKLKTPQRFFMPAIDPLTYKNQTLSKRESDASLRQYNIPMDLPLVVQISRFDRWKDPQGVIRAFRQARKKVDATLVLLGNAATDDPEGQEVYESLLHNKEERILILPYGDDTTLVSALQSRAAVIFQKSLREGFGLTVTEAMWKGIPVIGGNVGGIRYQIRNGYNGYLVDSVDEAAERLVKLLKDKKLRENMGKRAREGVRKNFLMTRLLEQYLDLFNSFRVSYDTHF